MKFILLLLAALLFFAFFVYPDKNLHIVTCDVGQGDASLVIYRNVQVLIDSGNLDSGIEECLGMYIPFWDKKIELAVITHPQLDHFGGFIDVFKSYKVDTIMISSLDSGTQEFEVLKSWLSTSQARITRPENNLKLRYGLMYLDVVWPTENYVRSHSRMKKHRDGELSITSRETTEDVNNFSIVLVVRLGKFEALFTGDIGPEVIPDILATQNIRHIEYIKVPHHGSKNGLTRDLLKVTRPEIAVISSGKGNSFGHPHNEVLELLNQAQVVLFRTDTHGDIEIVTDGLKYWVAN